MKIQGKQLADTLRSESTPFDAVYATEITGALNGNVRFKCKNGEAFAMSKGQAVYISGVSGDVPLVKLADADGADTMPCVGLTESAANSNSEVYVISFGNLTGIDTDSLDGQGESIVGKTVYVTDTPGALSVTKPSGSSSKLQNIGQIIRQHATEGIIKVGGAGRTAATPNLDEGHFFLGNASNQSVQSSYQFPTSVGTSGQVLASDGTNLTFQDVSTGSQLSYVATTSTNLNAALNTHYFLNTSSATVTINLPASPSVGDVVILLPRYNALQATINASTGDAVSIAGVSGNASSKEIFLKAGRAFKIIYGTVGSSNEWITEVDQIQMISGSGVDLASAFYWRGGFIYSTSTADQTYTLPNVNDVADGAYIDIAWLATSTTTDPDGVEPNSWRRSFTVTFNSDSGGNDIYKGGYAVSATNTYTFNPGGITRIIKRADKFYILSPNDTYTVHSIPKTAIIDYQYNATVYNASFTAQVNTIYNLNASTPITVTLPDPYNAAYGDTVELHVGFNDNSNTAYLTINAGGSGKVVTGRNWADVNGASAEVVVPLLHGTVKAIKVSSNAWLLLTSGSEISSIKNINTASTTTYTLSGSQGFTHIVDTSATGGNTTLYLPVAYLKNATTPIIIKIIDDTYDVIVSRAQSSSNTIDGETSITFTAGGGKKYLKFVPYENGKYAIFSGY